MVQVKSVHGLDHTSVDVHSEVGDAKNPRFNIQNNTSMYHQYGAVKSDCNRLGGTE